MKLPMKGGEKGLMCGGKRGGFKEETNEKVQVVDHLRGHGQAHSW